jgi:hypothetical protein
LAQHRDLGVVGTAGAHARVALGAGLLVSPVRRHTVLGVVMHGLGADLDLDGLAVGIAHHRVQRLVAIGLGPGDVVVKLFGQGCELLVHPAQGLVAIGHIRHHHAQSADVEHALKRQVLATHLLDDAVDVLGPPADLRGNPLPSQLLRQTLAQRGHVLFTLGAFFIEQPGNLPVGIGLQKAEGQVLQCPFDLPDAQPVGQWRKHMKRFARQGGWHRQFGGRVMAQGLQA